VQINLIFDSAAQGAPQGFRDAIQAAANILDAAFTDNIMVNISVGYGEIQGSPVTGGAAEGGPSSGGGYTYGSLLPYLQQELAGAVQSGLSLLPGGSSVQGQTTVVVWSAEEKALGLMNPNATALDGAVGFATDIPVGDLIQGALHELAHALGRVPYGSTPDIFDLFRYTGQGTLLFDNGPTPDAAAYFSLDGGRTDIADYGVNSDPSDFLNNGRTPNESFNEFYTSSTLQFLTPLDILQMEALGFHALAHPVGDYHGVGASDILWRNDNGDLNLWGSGAGSGPLQTNQDFGLVSTAWQVQQIADFNGDGRADILWRNTSTNDVLLWNSAPNATTLGFAGEDLGAAPSTWQIAATGDFNGDAPDQILWRNSATGDMQLWSGHAANANVIFANTDLGVVPTQWQIIGDGVFNNDGKEGLVWRNTGSNDVQIWVSNPGAGPVGFGTFDFGIVPSAWQLQGVADFSANGKADLLWRNTGSNDLQLWAGNGAGGFMNEDLGIVGAAWHVQETADFNGDGKADILWRNDSGDVVWWSAAGSGTSVTFASHDLGIVGADWHIQSDWHGTKAGTESRTAAWPCVASSHPLVQLHHHPVRVLEQGGQHLAAGGLAVGDGVEFLGLAHDAEARFARPADGLLQVVDPEREVMDAHLVELHRPSGVRAVLREHDGGRVRAFLPAQVDPVAAHLRAVAEPAVDPAGVLVRIVQHHLQAEDAPIERQGPGHVADPDRHVRNAPDLHRFPPRRQPVVRSPARA